METSMTTSEHRVQTETILSISVRFAKFAVIGAVGNQKDTIGVPKPTLVSCRFGIVTKHSVINERKRQTP